MDRVVIYLLRHGEVDFPEGVFYGQMDIPLSKTGKKQSRLAAKRLDGLDLDFVVTSDLSRCTYVAESMRSLSRERIRREPALREINFGLWQGLSWKEIDEAWPGQMERRMNCLSSFRPPEGESLSDLWKRSRDVFSACLEGRFGKRVAIIAHGGINRVFMCRLLGMDLQNLFSLHQDYACFNRVDSYPDSVRVLRFANCTCHLEGL